LDDGVSSTNHKGATAEGLIAGLKIRAMPVHLSWIQLGPWGCPDETGFGGAARFASYSVYPAGIVVDPATGRRIVNEWGDRRQRSDAIFSTGGPCIGIVDLKGAERDADSLHRCLKAGKIREFDSIRNLGKAYGMPSGALEKVVAEYNRHIGEGTTDRFGKAPGEDAHRIDAPPFYAVRLWPKVHYTSGGLGINARAQVIDLRGRPIPRLFAAGEVSGGVHGASRLGGCALPECIVFGRIAGREAAAMEP
jgi:flavocytochrome c